MLIKEYIEILEDEFQYLFAQHGFKVTYSEQVKPYEYRVGFESKTCRILFVRERGEGVIFLGTPTAGFYNEDDEQWFPLLGVINYLTREKIDWDIVGEYKDEERIRPTMRLISLKFKPICAEVFGMFSSTEVITTWKSEYKQYKRQSRSNS